MTIVNGMMDGEWTQVYRPRDQWLKSIEESGNGNNDFI